MRWGHAVRNVADAADPPTPKPPSMRVWTPAELGRFLARARHDDVYAAWLLAATTGMRRGEILGLHWSDVDLDTGRISVRLARVKLGWTPEDSLPKTARGRRSIGLDPVTVAALRAHGERQAEHRVLIGAAYVESDAVITKPDGSPIHPQLLSRWFDQRLRAAGLPRIRLHDVLWVPRTHPPS